MVNESLAEKKFKQQREKELIAQLKANSDAAFEQLVKNYSTKMYVICCRYFTCQDDAQECLQSAFVQVFQHIQTFKEDSQLSTWLHRITINCALMQIRSHKRRRDTSIESNFLNSSHIDNFYQHYNSYGKRTVFADHEGNNLETLFEKNELKLNITELILHLPEKYCNVLILRDIQELSTKESAQILAISPAAVKTQLHRARLLLKALLK